MQTLQEEHKRKEENKLIIQRRNESLKIELNEHFVVNCPGNHGVKIRINTFINHLMKCKMLK